MLFKNDSIIKIVWPERADRWHPGWKRGFSPANGENIFRSFELEIPFINEKIQKFIYFFLDYFDNQSFKKDVAESALKNIK